MEDTGIFILEADDDRFSNGTESSLIDISSEKVQAMLAPQPDWADRYMLWHPDLLERLARIDPTVRSFFSARSEVLPLLKLRMIAFKGTRVAEKPRYDALSYTWHRDSWSVSPDLKPDVESSDANSWPSDSGNGVACPLSRALWRVLLHESASSGNLFWVDQVCIDQDNEAEKNLSVTFTDRVYQNCQRTLIAIEDTSIPEKLVHTIRVVSEQTRTEAEKMISSNSTLVADIFEFCYRIFSSRWSTRGWCSHEFFSSDRHIFFIPIAKGVGSKIRILRMDSQRLKNIALICARKLQSATNEQMAIFVSHADVIGTLLRFATRVVKEHMPQTFLESFRTAFRARARLKRDQLVIALNCALSGLHYSGPALETDDACCRLIHIVAIAAGDASVIGVDGQSLVHPYSPPSSWLLAPTNDESRPGFQLMRQDPTPFEAKITEAGCLNLYIVKLGYVRDVLNPDVELVDVAWAFMGQNFSQIYTREPFCWEPSLQNGVEDPWVRDEMRLRFVNQQYFYAQVLGFVLSLEDRNFIDLLLFNGSEQPAPISSEAESHLSSVLGWLRQQRGISKATELVATVPAGVTYESQRCLTKYLIQFVNTILGVKGMYDPNQSHSWQSFKIGSLVSPKLSTAVVPVVVPRFCHSNEVIAVPADVTGADYSLLRRLWILRRAVEHSPVRQASAQEPMDCFEIVCKAMLAGKQDIDSTERTWVKIT